MAKLRRLPGLVLLRRHHLIEPSRRIFARALLRSQPAFGKLVYSVDFGVDPISDRAPFNHPPRSQCIGRAIVAVEIYAAIGGCMCLAWLALFHVLAIHPYLQEDYVEAGYFSQERHRGLFGVVLYAVAGAVGWAYSPSLALLIFLALPLFYGIGLAETRIGLVLRRGAPAQ
jgi:hypothetical protein